MSTNTGTCGCNGATRDKVSLKGKNSERSRIVDYRVGLLIAAGAAMAANCEPCLNKLVPDLIEAGVHEDDIRTAVELGQVVKDKPAGIMKQAADWLTGTSLSDGHPARECPLERMKKQSPLGA